MKNVLFAVAMLMCFASSPAFAAGRYRYLAVSLAGADKEIRSVAEIERKEADNSRSKFIETAYIEEDRGGGIRSGKAGRVNSAGDESPSEGALTIEDIAHFGLPLLHPEILPKEGETLREKFVLTGRASEVPVTVSYAFQKASEMMGRNVAVFDVTLNGVDYEAEGGARKRWAGIGYEVWDTGVKMPVIRVIEIKYGHSPADGVEFALERSEASLY